MAKKIKEPFMAINFELAIANQAKKANQAVKKKKLSFLLWLGCLSKSSSVQTCEIEAEQNKKAFTWYWAAHFFGFFFSFGSIQFDKRKCMKKANKNES